MGHRSDTSSTAPARRAEIRPAHRCAGLLWVVLLATTLVVRGAWTADATSSCRPEADQERRLYVSLFQYAGAEDAESKTDFSRFKGIIRDKITVLAEELDTGRPEFTYLRNLTLQPEGPLAFDDKLGSEAAADQYWNVSHSLLLLRGSIFHGDGKGYYARSRVYLGALRGELPRPSVSLQLPITDDAFPNTSDSHSLVIYYTLAMDAVRLRCDPALVLELLSRAQDKIRDLQHRGFADPSITELQQAVEHAVAVEKHSDHTP